MRGLSLDHVAASASGPSPPVAGAGLARAMLGFGGDTLLLASLTFAATGVGLLPLMLVGAELDAHALLLMAVSMTAMALAGWPLWQRTRRQPLLRAVMPIERSLWFGVAIGVAAFMLGAIKTWVDARWLGPQPLPSNIAPIELAHASRPWLAMGLFVLAAPLVEELLFRRVLFGRMIARGWPWLGAVLTTLLFAWMHEPLPGDGVAPLQWLWLLTGYAALGALFAWVYWRTRRWSAVFAAHAVNNLLACGVLWLGVN